MTDYLSSTQQTIAWVKRMAEENHLDMKPPFQRNPVWLDPQKAYLIDTIIRGYPVPELYMQVAVDDAGNESHIVVDGQQRIRACLEFIEGRFPLASDSDEMASGEQPLYPDAYFDDLPTEVKQSIFRYTFIIRTLPEMDDSQLRAIFRRLNRNVVALNQQELRHATYWGDFISLMEAISNWEFWTHCGLFTANDIRRMLDVEYISELAIGALHGPQNKKTTLDKWYRVYEESFEDGSRLETLFRTVTGEIDQLFPDISDLRWSKKSDFYSLFHALAERSTELPLDRDSRSALSEALQDFAAQVDEMISRIDELVAEESDEAEAPDVEVVDRAVGDDAVRRYTLAVGRAASDRASRRARLEVLRQLLDAVT